jgi:hypothetical protein
VRFAPGGGHRGVVLQGICLSLTQAIMESLESFAFDLKFSTKKNELLSLSSKAINYPPAEAFLLKKRFRREARLFPGRG